jgi:signal transduction histidine kinase
MQWSGRHAHADRLCVSEGSTQTTNQTSTNDSRGADFSAHAQFAESVVERLADAQQQLDMLRQQLTDSQRLATIGTIAAVIAHEFNNILTPVVSYSQYALTSAQSETPDMELIRKALTKSFQGASKAGRICTSMLALARGESTPGVVSVQHLVDEALLVLARDPQKDGIALRVQVQPDLLVNVDPVQLEQVLLNLLINARQAMLGKGGSLTIKAAPIEEQGVPTEARVQVIDTGPGIPEKVLPKIFQPFFTTKGTARIGEHKGSGLGLAICREIVEHHRGRIEVQSAMGKGTTFSVYLPIAAAAQ